MIPLLEKINEGKILLSDGAMGTELFKRGLQFGNCPELLNIEKPEVLKEIAMAYLNAGSDLVSTNTFGGSAVKLADYNLQDKTVELNQAAVKIVKEAVAEKAYTVASIGPSGKVLVPYGDTEPGTLRVGFKIQIEACINAGADAILIETMTDLNEALIAVECTKKINSSIPVMATMTFDETPRGFYTIMGTSIEQAIQGLTGAGVDILGSNCGNGLEKMIKIGAEFKKHSDLPILIQSNAGIPENKNGELFYPESPQFFADRAGQLKESGVAIIGGCCGTSPEYIAAIRKALDSL